MLCELLPAAISSLVLNLAVLAAGAHTIDVSKNANRLLLCDAAVELMSPEALVRNSNQVNSQLLLITKNRGHVNLHIGESVPKIKSQKARNLWCFFKTSDGTSC